MRIVFYTHMGQLGNGGTESLFGIVKELSKKHDCYVITPYKGDLNYKLSDLGIQNSILPFKWSSNVNNSLKHKSFKQRIAIIKQWFKRNMFNQKHKRKHVQLVKKYQPDIIYSNTSVITIGIKVAKELNTPHIWHLREFQDTDITPDFGYRYLVKYLNKSTSIIVNSQLLKTYYEQFINSNKIEVVHNGIALPVNTKSVLKNNKDESSYVFLMVGALIPVKGHLEVLKAIKKLKCKNKNFQLHIVGEGKLRSQIENYIDINNLNEQVILHGQHSDVDKFYVNADCYVMCSESETFGRVTVEAMLCGLPIIGRNAPYNATKEIIRNEVDGWLYTTTDELVGKMEWMMNNPNLGIKMGVSAEKWARNNFSLQHSVQQIEEVLLKNVVVK